MALMQMPIATIIQSYLKSSPAYKAYASGTSTLSVQGLEGYPLALFLRLLSRREKKRIWVICPTEESALALLKDSGFRVDAKSVMQTPLSREEVKTIYLPSHGRKLYSSFTGDDIEYSQLKRLSSIKECPHGIIVTHLRPFVSQVVSPKALGDAELTIHRNCPFDPTRLAEELGGAGYINTVATSSPGEFSVRGEVMDIFPYESDSPYRIYADWEIGRAHV